MRGRPHTFALQMVVRATTQNRITHHAVSFHQSINLHTVSFHERESNADDDEAE